jgi:SAM-dependent methyltransferase
VREEGLAITTAYDEVAYPTHAFRQTHPDRLAAHAKLFGLPCADIETCRVLDIGGGDGANLIPMAVAYPRAQFVGFDLSHAAIERGRDMIKALGLANIELVADDIMTADYGAAAFDYVLTHGVYSWVPDVVRDALLTSIKRHLAPDGVAFVSYNAMPGGRIRQALRDRLLFAVRDVRGPAARASAAREHLLDLIDGLSKDDPFQVLLLVEARRLHERGAAVLAHDELSEVFHPVHFYEFRGHAERAGLQFLTGAEASRCSEGFTPPDAIDDPNFDVLAQVQDSDFKNLRYFRQDLLIHADKTISRVPQPARLLGLHVSSCAVRNDDGAFQVGASQINVADATLLEALETLVHAWPATVPMTSVIDDLDHAEAMLRMYWHGVVELHAAPSTYATKAGARPCASPYARLQAAAGQSLLATLNHGMVEVKDDFSQKFIAGLDGSRDRAEIARDLAPKLGGTIESVIAQMDGQLDVLAKMPLLVS